MSNCPPKQFGAFVTGVLALNLGLAIWGAADHNWIVMAIDLVGAAISAEALRMNCKAKHRISMRCNYPERPSACERVVPVPEPKPDISSAIEGENESDRLVDLELARFREADEQDRLAARDLVPDVSVLTSLSGRKFIAAYGVELPAEYVVSIVAHSLGNPPNSYIMPRMDFEKSHLRERYKRFASPASKAQIEIQLTSGRKFYVAVNRHSVEIVMDALMRAWRDVR